MPKTMLVSLSKYISRASAFSTYAVAYKDKSDSKNAAKDVKKSNESKKIEKAKSAKTSDNMQADLMLIVFIIGAAAIVVSLRRKRS